MKISEHWASYVTYTADFSDSARNTAFAGIALAWVLRSADFQFPRRVLFGLVAIVSCLLIDLLQVYLAAIIHRVWLRREERRQHQSIGEVKDRDLAKPAWLDLPAFVLFNAKALLLVGGYSLLGLEVWARL